MNTCLCGNILCALEVDRDYGSLKKIQDVMVKGMSGSNVYIVPNRQAKKRRKYGQKKKDSVGAFMCVYLCLEKFNNYISVKFCLSLL